MDYLFILFLIIVSLIVTVLKTPEKAFAWVYLPVLFFCPLSYNIKIAQGIPAITMVTAVLLPLIPFLIIMRGHNWKFSITDILVAAYVLEAGVSEYANDSYWQAQNSVFFHLTYVIFPYMCAKLCIVSKNNSGGIAREIVIFGFFISLTMIVELFTAKNIFSVIFWRIFPGQISGYGPSRWGFQRPFGSFLGPISAGLGLVAVFRLFRWLQTTKQLIIENSSSTYRLFFGLANGYFLPIVILIGIFTTFSRGPWLGAVAGSFIYGIALRPNIRKTFITRLFIGIILIFGSLYAYDLFISKYDTASAESSVIYRARLWGAYEDFIYAKPMLGWGTLNPPTLEGAPSIDNHYIFLLVWHGFLSLILFFTITGFVSLRLINRGLKYKAYSQQYTLLTFTFLSIIAAFLVTLYTVYLDVQLTQLLFLIIGWAEAHLLWREPTHETSKQIKS